MSMTTPADLKLALECARSALKAGQPPTACAPQTPTSTSTDRATAVIRHRLSQLVVNSSKNGAFDEADWDRLTNDAFAHTHAALQLVRHTAHVVGLLGSENIDFLVIKGIALGALSQTPASRGAGDVDILVDPGNIARVHRVSRDGDFRPALSQPNVSKPRTWQVWSFLDRETTYIGHSTYIDLHWRISSQRHLFPPFAKLYSRRTTVTVADTQIPTLCQADSLAAACYHAYFDQFQPLRSLIDVLSLIPAVSPESLAPDLPRPLQKLMAGVITVVTDEFPDLVDTQAQALLAVLPAPPRIVRKRFDQAVVTPRRAWEETQDQKALVAKLLSEAHFDSPFEVVPRFVGKRLLAFPAWSESQETTSLSAAVWRRWRVESDRRRSTG